MRKILVMLGLVVLCITGCSIDPTKSFFQGIFVGVFGFLGLWYIFWPLMAVFFCVISWMVEDKDNHTIPILVLLVFGFAIADGARELNPLSYAEENLQALFAYLLMYAGIGIGWSFIKLRMCASELSRNWEKEKRDFLEEPDNNEEGWYKYVSKKHYTKPAFSHHEYKIFSWAAYWPFSMFWFFCSDFLRKVWDLVYDYLKNAYRYVFESAIGNILNDYKKAEELRKNRE